MRLSACLLIPLLAAAAPAPPKLAFFGFDLINTSPAATADAELDRAKRLGTQFAQAVETSGKYVVVDGMGLRAAFPGGTVQGCNGCELDAARTLGARFAAYGWVQKVSNLILNLNIRVEDVASGKQVAGGSVDIRGNTDDSWRHGLHFLLEEHVLDR